MSISNLPPQAYTRDTVLEAFNWLNSQPESVRRLAKNEDALVSLYLRAKRFGGVGSPLEQEAPVSSKKFKSDLKTLAQGLKDFDVGGTPPPAKETAKSAPEKSGPRETQEPLPPAPQRETPQPARPPVSGALLEGLRPTAAASAASLTAAATSGGPLELDILSQRQIRRTMDILNLSSESEALRLLITLGAQRVQKLLD